LKSGDGCGRCAGAALTANRSENVYNYFTILLIAGSGHGACLAVKLPRAPVYVNQLAPRSPPGARTTGKNSCSAEASATKVLDNNLFHEH